MAHLDQDRGASAVQSTTSTPDLLKRRKEIAALIARLLSHYWTSDDHPAARRAQAEDWIDDLIEFPIDSVRNGCAEWRRTQHRRPTPGDVLPLVIAHQRRAREREELRALAPPAPPAPRPPVKHPWEPGFSCRYDEPWFQGLDYELRQNYLSQDQARLEMHNRILDGDADAAQFSELCIQQAKTNLRGIDVSPATLSAGDYAKALGASATEATHMAMEVPQQ